MVLKNICYKKKFESIKHTKHTYEICTIKKLHDSEQLKSLWKVKRSEY